METLTLPRPVVPTADAARAEACDAFVAAVRNPLIDAVPMVSTVVPVPRIEVKDYMGKVLRSYTVGEPCVVITLGGCMLGTIVDNYHYEHPVNSFDRPTVAFDSPASIDCYRASFASDDIYAWPAHSRELVARLEELASEMLDRAGYYGRIAGGLITHLEGQ